MVILDSQVPFIYCIFLHNLERNLSGKELVYIKAEYNIRINVIKF